jgi:hypothetical protein
MIERIGMTERWSDAVIKTWKYSSSPALCEARGIFDPISIVAGDADFHSQ